MKPEWKDAPKWANWLAQDANGDWYWYKEKPEPDSANHIWHIVAKFGYKYRRALMPYVEKWYHTLESRPE